MTWQAEIANPLQVFERTMDLHISGLPEGRTTGWPTLDRCYNVLPGLWTVVTGYPGSGKSEFVDALVLNLTRLHNWRFCYYSPENQPQEFHLAKLLEKWTGKPFFKGQTERMTMDEASTAAFDLRDRVAFIKQEDGPKSIDEILGLCFEWIKHSDEKNPAGIIIDPWNEIEHEQPQGLTESNYISKSLTKIRQFARNTKCHIWIVAHPKLIVKDKEGRRPVPTLSDISGGAMWWNKSDYGIVVHRDQSLQTQDVEIHIQKVRYKYLGRQDMVTLKYDRASGTYHEPFGVSILPMSRKARASGEQPI
jgi:twinkle protein